MPLDPTLVRGLTPIAMPERDPNAAVNQLGMMMKMQELQSGIQSNQLNAQKYQQEIATSQATERKARQSVKVDAFRNAARMIGPNGPALLAMLGESTNDAEMSEILGIRPQHLPVIEQQLQANPENVTKLWRRMVGMSANEEAELAKPQTTLGKLQAELAQLPSGDPRRAQYEAAINKETRFPPTEAGQLPADVRTAQWYAKATPEEKAAFDRAAGKGDTGKVAHVLTDNAGNVRMFTGSGEEVTPKTAAGAPPPKGKPSATFEKTAALRQQLTADINRTIPELEEISKEGGLIDQSTGSGIGRGIDWLARQGGVALPGDIAISRLQPIADMVLKMVPRFEGPQSDKDTQSYKEAAGQLADATLPPPIRKAAAKEILRLMTTRKGQFVSTEMASEGLAAQEAAGAPSEPAPPSGGVAAAKSYVYVPGKGLVPK